MEKNKLIKCPDSIKCRTLVTYDGVSRLQSSVVGREAQLQFLPGGVGLAMRRGEGGGGATWAVASGCEMHRGTLAGSLLEVIYM